MYIYKVTLFSVYIYIYTENKVIVILTINSQNYYIYKGSPGQTVQNPQSGREMVEKVWILGVDYIYTKMYKLFSPGREMVEKVWIFWVYYV